MAAPSELRAALEYPVAALSEAEATARGAYDAAVMIKVRGLEMARAGVPTQPPTTLFYRAYYLGWTAVVHAHTKE